jgi:L-lysine 2,3-aminomutase
MGLSLRPHMIQTEPQKTWQDEVRSAFRDPSDLAGFLGLAMGNLPPVRADGAFPFLVPRPFAERMAKGDPLDPLLRQVWPDATESVASAAESLDPVGDHHARKVPGLLHKYAGRALVVATGACAVHCRYCFRQNFPYDEAARSREEWAGQLEAIRQDPSIRELILSGGDPLSLPDAVLAGRIADLESVPHLETLRIHTRLPVAVPSRVTDEFCQILSRSRFAKIVVLHANHPAELDGAVGAASAKLRATGSTLLNQSVLLRGVNDDAAVLEALSRRLWECGVLPYYLHALDRVVGSSRFLVSDNDGICLVDALRARLPGYLVPRLVRETEGEPGKMPVGRVTESVIP